MAELENEKSKEETKESREGLSFQSLGTQPEWKQETEKLQSSINVAMTVINSYGEELKKISKIINNFKNQLQELDKKIINIKDSIRKTELRSIEVIGIISAIIALVLVFISTANKIDDIKNAYIILVTGTSSLVLFSVLLHHFFNKEDKRGKLYYFLFFVIPLLIIIGLGIYILFLTK